MDQHYKVSVEVHGHERVMFVTDLGWSYATSATADICNKEGIIGAITNFLRLLTPVPYENMCDHEEAAAQCNKDIQSAIEHLGKSLGELDDRKDTKMSFVSNNLCVSVSLEKTYVVSFGEENEDEQASGKEA